MSAPIAAAIRGADYQALLVWLNALLLLDESEGVESVGFEDAAVQPGDDLIILRAPSDPRPSEYWQIKYHVNHAGTYSSAELMRPTGRRSKSLLRRLWAVWSSQRGKRPSINVGIMSNWSWDERDPLRRFIRDEGHLDPELALSSEPAARQIRSTWQSHINCDDAALSEFIPALRLRTSELSLHRLEEVTGWRMGSLGLSRDRGAMLVGVRLVKVWIARGQRYISRSDLEQALDVEGLRRTRPGQALPSSLQADIASIKNDVAAVAGALLKRRTPRGRGVEATAKEVRLFERRLVRLQALDRARDVISTVRLAEAQLARTRSSRMRYLAAAHTGLALRRMHRFNDALKHFRRALRFDPSRPQGMANVAQAFADLENMPQAEKWASQVLAVMPENPTALFVRVQCLLKAMDFEEARRVARRITDRMVAVSAKANIAAATLGAAAKRRALARGLRLERAPELLINYAQSLVEIDRKRAGPSDFVPWIADDPARRRRASEALLLLEEAEAILRGSKSQDTLAECLMFKAILTDYVHRRRLDSAVREGVELAPENPKVIRNAIQFYLEHGDGHNALVLLRLGSASKRIVEGGEQLEARALLFTRSYAELRAFCSRRSVQARIGAVEREALLAEADLQEGHAAVALERMQKVPVGERSARVLVIQARAMFRMGAIREAFAMLRDDALGVSVEDRWRVVFARATMLSELHLWREAAVEYSRIFSTAALEEVTSAFLTALYNADMLGTCIRVGREVVKTRVGAIAPDPLVRALIELGYLDEAEQHARTALSADEGDASARVSLAEIQLKRGRIKEARDAVPEIGDAARLGTHEALRVAELCVLVGLGAKALQLGLVLGRKMPDEVEAQWLLVKLVQNLEGLAPTVLKPEVIEQGTRVLLEANSSQSVLDVLPNGTHGMAPNELLPFSADAQALFGKRVGETVSTGVWAGHRVLEIRSLYGEVAMESLARFASDPSQRGRVEAVAGDSEIVARLAASASQADEQRRGLQTAYESELPPLGALGEVTGHKSAEIWYALVGGEFGSLVEVARRWPPEEPALVRNVGSAKVLVLEQTTLLALAEWDVLEAVANGSWKMCVALSAIGDLEEMRYELALRRYRRSGMVTLDGGKPVLQLADPMRVERAIGLYDRLLTWIRAHVEVQPVPIQQADGRFAAAKALGRGAVDSLLISKALQGVLVSEDLGLRMLAERLARTPGGMALSVVSVLADAGILERARADTARARALAWGYSKIIVDTGATVAAVALDDGNCGEFLTRLVRRTSWADLNTQEALEAALCIVEGVRGTSKATAASVLALLEASLRKRHRGGELWERVRDSTTLGNNRQI